ncbi:MAG: hypothetical protein K0S44_420 [Bacteroidetes bacterium]|jgi:hypothetical protein|nr:hypothetical protein [Bacteroidota bacterium]
MKPILRLYLYYTIYINPKNRIMKTIISLALVSILIFPGCKKSEIQDIKPAKQTSGEAVEPQKEPLVGSDIHVDDPANAGEEFN